MSCPGLFPYYGGKARLAPWIVSQLPPHRCYVEPFCGGARVLFAKERSPIEVINDLDTGVVSAFRVARDHPDQLAHLLRLTPYSREELRRAAELTDDEVEAARRFLIGAFQSRFSRRNRTWSCEKRSWGRSDHIWPNLPSRVTLIAARLAGVAIECRPADRVIKFFDAPDTLFYCDPPYHPETCDCSGYRHTLTAADHRDLVELLRGVQGMVVLSGYRHPDYDDHLPGWRAVEREVKCGSAAGSGGNPRRVEVLWFNPSAQLGQRAA